MIPAQLAGVLDAATAATDWADYERPLFELLDRAIGFDLAFCIRENRMGPHAPGFDSNVRRHTGNRMHEYAPEYHALKAHALSRNGVGVDATFFGRCAFERTRTYRDIIRPHHGRSSLLLFVGTPDKPLVTVVLGRTGSDFEDRDADALGTARSLVALCESDIAQRQHTQGPRLSPRERELIRYLRLGYTNPEIATACGTSFRTVRNQLSHLFEKLEVSTRSEAVARSFELSMPLT